jgi:hypothetical protein
MQICEAFLNLMSLLAAQMLILHTTTSATTSLTQSSCQFMLVAMSTCVTVAQPSIDTMLPPCGTHIQVGVDKCG